jgi:hypothetical protein
VQLSPARAARTRALGAQDHHSIPVLLPETARAFPAHVVLVDVRKLAVLNRQLVARNENAALQLRELAQPDRTDPVPELVEVALHLHVPLKYRSVCPLARTSSISAADPPIALSLMMRFSLIYSIRDFRISTFGTASARKSP